MADVSRRRSEEERAEGQKNETVEVLGLPGSSGKAVLKLVVESAKGRKAFVLRFGEKATDLAEFIVSESGLPRELKQALEFHLLQRCEEALRLGAMNDEAGRRALAVDS